MNTKKLVILFVLLILLLPIPTGVAAAETTPYPDCGKHTISFFGNLFSDGYDDNVQLDSELIGGIPYISIVTSHGWETIEVDLLLAQGGTQIYTFPNGTTKALFPPPGVPLIDLIIKLKKDCYTCGGKPTGRYVYTLLGNYPCNLISEEKTIPARFLDPGYTGPLCNLPNLDHNWNGDWVKNKEINCGGYFVGGKHYDTSLGELP